MARRTEEETSSSRTPHIRGFMVCHRANTPTLSIDVHGDIVLSEVEQCGFGKVPPQIPNSFRAPQIQNLHVVEIPYGNIQDNYMVMATVRWLIDVQTGGLPVEAEEEVGFSTDGYGTCEVYLADDVTDPHTVDWFTSGMILPEVGSLEGADPQVLLELEADEADNPWGASV